MPEESTQAPAPEAAPFASALRAREAPARSRQRLLALVLAATGLHAAALLGLASLWHGAPRRREGDAHQGEVLVLRLSAVPPAPRAGDVVQPTPPPPRPRAARRPRPSRAPPPPRATAPPSTPEPLSVGRPAGIASQGGGSLAERAVAGITQRALGAEVTGLLTAPPPAAAPEAPEDAARRSFEEMFRDRFNDVPYPDPARMAGIEGRLVLRISVGAQGQLVSMRVLGVCPHPVLCEAAQEAVRHAAPFPPPPPALGGRVTVELPFNYHLE
ncbi:TonB family protein [Corallococcus macrosporus]|uniref:Biopolymer transporter TonB n=1 Tax=Corallococcus macrosporus DSM 14697 TaxID=1189310 RepID=A0A250JNE8_9BACT|nr:TonB family protein [Corallococcus macrosporus]ATB45012.1 biopolymer transporter TonB [Corallococcus macrosporus DSM 14697]